MPRRTNEDDGWGEREDDAEEGDKTEEYDSSKDEEEPTIPCPYCKRQIHEDAPRCPYCENYISREDAPPSRKPWWIIIGVLLALYAVFRWNQH